MIPSILVVNCGSSSLKFAVFGLTVRSPALETLLYRRSGLLGLSGMSADMRELLAHRDDTPEAAQAIDYLCHRALHFIGALSAALVGLDRLIFTDGIGANAPAVRAHICDGLAYLGITLDDRRNCEPEPAISAADSPVQVKAVTTDEELMIARHVQRTLANAC
jgi:acetate kinase